MTTGFLFLLQVATKIGFVDKEGAIVVKPQFTMYYGDCYDESDNIRVSVDCLYGFIRSGGRVATYKRPIYGLINYKGETIFEPSFYSLIPAIGNKNLYTVQDKNFWICCFKHKLEQKSFPLVNTVG